MRSFLHDTIVQYLGEPEESLITVVHTHVCSSTSAKVAALEPELQEVLEEDAAAFVDAVYAKALEYATEYGN